jgi:O-antigen ligase
VSAALSTRFEGLGPVPLTILTVTCAALGLLAGVDPRLAIAGALAIAFVLLALADLTAGLVVFTLGVFLEYILPAGPALSFPKLGGLLLGVSWLALVTTRSSARPTFLGVHPWATCLLAAFLAWSTLSATWADDPAPALTDISRYAPNFLLFLIVFTAVRTRRQAAWVIGGLVAGAAVAAIYGLVVPPDPTADAFRIESAAGNSNVLAAVSITGLVLSLGGALALRGSPVLRCGLVAVAALCLAASLLTGSRSGVIALGAVLVAAILFGGRWRAGAVVAAILVAVAATAFVAFYAPPEVRERITQTSPGEVSSDEGRVTIWQVGWRMVEDEPLRGIGVGNFSGSAIDYVLEPGLLTRTDQIIDTPKVAHNIYLHVLAELGVVGLALFLAILGFCLRCAHRAARRFRALGDERMEIVARALLIAMIGVLVSDFFASEQFSKVLWLLLALGPALEWIARGASAPGRPA